MRKAILYVVIIAEIALITSLVRGIQVSRKARERAVNLEEKKETLLAEQRELQDQLEFVKSPEYIERVARDELQLSKEGEKVVIVPEEAIVNETSELAQEDEELKNYQKWWRVLTGQE